LGIKQGNTIVDEVKRLVGDEDTLFQSFEAVIASYAKVHADIQKSFKKASGFQNSGLTR
jgi:hypothetical protein